MLSSSSDRSRDRFLGFELVPAKINYFAQDSLINIQCTIEFYHQPTDERVKQIGSYYYGN